MAFTARIELIGLFRFWPDRGDDGEVDRIFGLAPWTGPGAWDQERDEGSKPEPLHHLVAMWWPRSQYEGLPPSAMTLWPLGGMELTFDYETRERPRFKVDLQSIQLPFMTSRSAGTRRAENGRTGSIVPPEHEKLAELHPDHLAKVGDFEADDGDASIYTYHLGIQKNTAGLMGRVVIDRGEVETDDLTSQESFLSPSLWKDETYSGYFTNRINVIVPETRGIVMRARNLITGNLAGEVRLATGDRELLIQVAHLCPEQLLSDCPDVPRKDPDDHDDTRPYVPYEDRDEDFHRLYDLSVEPELLKGKMKEMGKKPTVPVGYYDGHTCRQTRCGSCVG